METKKKGATFYVFSAAWWIADGLWKDDVFKWARPRLPGFVVNPPVADLASAASTFGVPLALFFLGTYFYFRKPLPLKSEPGFVLVYSRAAFGAVRTQAARVLPIHVITLGLAVVFAGVVWQYLQSQQTRPVAVTSPLTSAPETSNAPQSNLEAAARAADIRDAAAKAEASRPPLSAYEVELKLRLIDQTLKILSETMEPTIANGPRLQTGAWNAFKDTKNHPNYRENLLTYLNAVRDNAKTLDDLRDRNPQYQDIVSVTQQTYYNSVYPAVEDFVSTYGRLASYLKDDVSNDSFEYLMKVPRDKFGMAIQQFTQWRNTVRGQLIELRRKLSP